VAVGGSAQATGTNSTAVGDNAVASGNTSVAMGNNANASATNSVALGSGSIANQANTVSMGAAGSERRITNVAPGVGPTDAVNMSQFSGLASDVSALRSDISEVARQAYRGITGVAALTAGPPAIPGKTSVNLGVGAYRGYVAGAITAFHTTETGKMNFNGGVGINAGSPIYRAGVGFSF
jgi:trimeric autotransporter adhesin